MISFKGLFIFLSGIHRQSLDCIVPHVLYVYLYVCFHHFIVLLYKNDK